MILTEQKFRAERGKRVETYQSFTATVEAGERGFLTVELDNLTRWRSKKEYADYLRWAASEIESLPII
jgi:lysine/ornithine N-monooxygenase